MKREFPAARIDLLLRIEQIKTNMQHFAGNRDVLDYVGPNFLAHVQHYRDVHGQREASRDYVRWYVDFRNGRL